MPLNYQQGTKLIDTIRNPSTKLKDGLKKLTDKQIKQLLALFIPVASQLTRHILLSNFEIDTESDATPQNKFLFQNQGMSFLFCVLVPCMLEYHIPPHTLYEQAIEGDYDSLEMLISIDKNIITHPKIASIWAQLASNPTSYNYKRISKALSSKPNSRTSVKSTKITHAALIEMLFNKYNEQGWSDYKIRRTEIIELFDTIAGELDNTSCDIDLPEAPEAREKAVNREIKRLSENFETLYPPSNNS